MVHLTFTVPYSKQVGSMRVSFTSTNSCSCSSGSKCAVTITPLASALLGTVKLREELLEAAPSDAVHPANVPACTRVRLSRWSRCRPFHFLAGGTADAAPDVATNSTGTLAPRTAIGSEEINPSGTPSGSGMAAVLSGRRSCVDVSVGAHISKIGSDSSLERCHPSKYSPF